MNKTLTAKKRLRFILTSLILAGLCLIGTDLLVYLLATFTDLSMEALDSNFLYWWPSRTCPSWSSVASIWGGPM